jgi:hypothetical protein
VLGLPDGIPGLVMVIDTFEDYTIFHSHLHAIVSDGLFRKNGTFYTLFTCEMKQLEEIFRSMILTMLKRKSKIADDLIISYDLGVTVGSVFTQGNASIGMTRTVRRHWLNISCATPLPTCLSVARGEDYLHRGRRTDVVPFCHDSWQEQEEL